MKAFSRSILALLLGLLATNASAETWAVSSGTKYRIVCQQYDGYVCLGSYQYVYYPVYYQTSYDEISEDGWWYIELDQSSLTDSTTYTIRNAASGQYLTYSSDYQSDRYMNLADEVDDYCRWHIYRYDGDNLAIQNAGLDNQYWNLRTGTNQVGAGTHGDTSSNAHFLIYDENGDILQEGDAGDVVPMTQITLNHTGLKMPTSCSYALTYTYQPEDATDTRVSWSSSNTAVATVNNGTITAIANGTATITATAKRGGATAQCQVEVYTPGSDTSTGGDTLFVFQANGRMEAFPKVLMKSQTRDAQGNLIITMSDGSTWNYDARDLDSVTVGFRGTLPEITSFKFNNKFNDQLMKDIEPDTITSVIKLHVTNAIGKRLTPSFKTSTDDCGVFVDGEEQQSKVTRRRFEEGSKTDYVVAPRYYKVYASTGKIIYDTSDPQNPVPLGGDASGYEMRPYGRHYSVEVTWATDETTSQYKVPQVYITTDDGDLIYSKTTYETGTITIDGAGVYDDLEQTAFYIKGRGNSSWSGGSGKEPYHFKFDTKQKILGMTKGKHWVLLANKQNGSMTTNALALKMADMVGSAACNHIVPCDLYINGVYRGSYNMTEKIGFSNNSIDLDDETGAFLLQLDSYYDEEYKWRDDAYNLYNMVMEPDLAEIKTTDPVTATNEFSAIQEHWNNFTAKVKANNFTDELDVDAMARAMFVTDLSRNQELKHPKSWYIYNESALAPNGDGSFTLNEESPYVLGPVWDFDWGYGYDGTGQYFVNSASEDLFQGMTNSNIGYPFFYKLLRGNDMVKKAYYRVWHDFMTSGGLTELLEYAQDYYDYVNASFQHNATKWSDGGNYASQTANSQDWLQKRANYIYNNLTEYDLDDDPVITIGDVNEDGAITAADLVCVLNYIHGLENDDFSFKQADTDANDLVTMHDATAIISLIMGQAANAPRQLRLPEAGATLCMTPFQAYVDQTALMPITLNLTDGEYSGLQFDLHVPNGVELGDLRLPESLNAYTAQTQWIDENTYRVILYASAHDLLPQDRIEMQLELTPEQPVEMSQRILTLTEPMLVTSDGQDHRVKGSSVHFDMPETDGIQMAKSNLQSQQGDGRLYDLSGRRVERAQHGIYIINGKKLVR